MGKKKIEKDTPTQPPRGKFTVCKTCGYGANYEDSKEINALCHACGAIVKPGWYK